MRNATLFIFLGLAFVLSGCTAVDKQTADSVQPDISQSQEIQDLKTQNEELTEEKESLEDDLTESKQEVQTDETVTTKPEPKSRDFIFDLSSVHRRAHWNRHRSRRLSNRSEIRRSWISWSTFYSLQLRTNKS